MGVLVIDGEGRVEPVAGGVGREVPGSRIVQFCLRQILLGAEYNVLVVIERHHHLGPGVGKTEVCCRATTAHARRMLPNVTSCSTVETESLRRRAVRASGCFCGLPGSGMTQ